MGGIVGVPVALEFALLCAVLAVEADALTGGRAGSDGCGAVPGAPEEDIAILSLSIGMPIRKLSDKR